MEQRLANRGLLQELVELQPGMHLTAVVTVTTGHAPGRPVQRSALRSRTSTRRLDRMVIEDARDQREDSGQLDRLAACVRFQPAPLLVPNAPTAAGAVPARR